MAAGKLPGSGTCRSGFTLMEIMLALLVITIGIVAAIGLLSFSLDTSTKAHEDLDVVSFSDMVLNYCHATTNWNALPTSGNLEVPDYDEGTVSLQLGSISRFTCRVAGTDETADRYTVMYRLNIDPAHFSADIKQISLEVWPGYSAEGQPRRFYTEVYNWGKN